MRRKLCKDRHHYNLNTFALAGIWIRSRPVIGCCIPHCITILWILYYRAALSYCILLLHTSYYILYSAFSILLLYTAIFWPAYALRFHQWWLTYHQDGLWCVCRVPDKISKSRMLNRKISTAKYQKQNIERKISKIQNIERQHIQKQNIERKDIKVV